MPYTPPSIPWVRRSKISCRNVERDATALGALLVGGIAYQVGQQRAALSAPTTAEALSPRATETSAASGAAPAAPAPTTLAPPPAVDAAAPAARTAAEQTVIGVARQASPAVVSVTRDGGSGSGIIVRRDGVMLTNAHVVGQAAMVQMIG